MALLVIGLACGHFNSGARVRSEDVFRVLLAEPATDVPIVGDATAVPPGAVLLGYAVEVRLLSDTNSLFTSAVYTVRYEERL
jgi:hypothetical protein